MNKIISYLGFAIKSKNLITGQTALRYTKKTINLIIVCGSASDNLKNLAKNLSSKYNCEFIVTKTLLQELTGIEDVKIVGLTDESLSNAIIKHKEIISIG